MRRSVSFSKSSMIRMTEIIAEPSSPVPVELKTDHEAAMRNEDGPRPAATLLDDLIVVSHRPCPLKIACAVLVSVQHIKIAEQRKSKLFGTKTHHNRLLRQLSTVALTIPLSGCGTLQAFFERGVINSPEDIQMHLNSTYPGLSGELPACGAKFLQMHTLERNAPYLLVTLRANLQIGVRSHKLDANGGFVGLLPSNVRLGLEHKPYLSQLLSWLNDAKASRASGSTVSTVY